MAQQLGSSEQQQPAMIGWKTRNTSQPRQDASNIADNPGTKTTIPLSADRNPGRAECIFD